MSSLGLRSCIKHKAAVARSAGNLPSSTKEEDR